MNTWGFAAHIKLVSYLFFLFFSFAIFCLVYKLSGFPTLERLGRGRYPYLELHSVGRWAGNKPSSHWKHMQTHFFHNQEDLPNIYLFLVPFWSTSTLSINLSVRWFPCTRCQVLGSGTTCHSQAQICTSEKWSQRNNQQGFFVALLKLLLFITLCLWAAVFAALVSSA